MSQAEATGPGRAIAVGVGVAVMLGLAIAGGSVLRGSGTDATAHEALPYAGIGALAGLVVAVVVYTAWRASGPGAARPRPLLVLAAMFVMAAIGSLLGAAFTPHSVAADDVSPLSDEVVADRVQDASRFADTTRAGTVDGDGDGVADRDANGDVVVAYDVDGDGVADGYLQPCPPGTARHEPRPGYTAFDADCDGSVDRWLKFDSDRMLVPSGGDVPDVRPPDTIPPSARSERAEDESNAGTRSFLRTLLLILAVVAVAAAIIAWIVRSSDQVDGEADDDGTTLDDADPPPEGSPLPPPALVASLDALLADPDPRRAICAAYGRLLDDLAAAGLPRLAHEAPEEHVARVLDHHHIDPAATRRLLELFAIARFSSHPITEDHRREAIAAMRATNVTAAAR